MNFFCPHLKKHGNGHCPAAELRNSHEIETSLCTFVPVTHTNISGLIDEQAELKIAVQARQLFPDIYLPFQRLSYLQKARCIPI